MRRAILVGGLDRLGPTYAAGARAEGWNLTHCPGKLGGGAADLILVVVPICSHELREAAERSAQRQRAPITYLRTASVSALRAALRVATEGRHAADPRG